MPIVYQAAIQVYTLTHESKKHICIQLFTTRPAFITLYREF